MAGSLEQERSLRLRLLGAGREPDPRFSLANERTFLAWIRTALALLAGGIAVEAFTGSVFTPEVRTLTSVSLLLLAVLLSASAGVRWLQVERAMRQSRPLPFPLLVPVLSIGGVLVTLLMIGVLIGRSL